MSAATIKFRSRCTVGGLEEAEFALSLFTSPKRFGDKPSTFTATAEHPETVRNVWKRWFWWRWEVKAVKNGQVLESGWAWDMKSADRIAKHWAKVYDQRIASGNHWLHPMWPRR